MIKILSIILIIVLPQLVLGQNNIIDVNSNKFVDWAVSGTINRGYINISDTSIVDTQTSLNTASGGNLDSCFGKPSQNMQTVSLGDSGYATLSFNLPIVNGDGDDFAVFENGFFYPTNQDTLGFFELAFVEVSSDGINFVRFPSESKTQFQTQIGTYETIHKSDIYNLASACGLGYGTAFDLNDITDSNNIDINNITHIRVVDAIGCIQDDFCTYDSFGNKINDPWPTAFATGGFDLAGIGVIHNTENLNVNSISKNIDFKIYPNPASDFVTVTSLKLQVENYSIIDITGNVLKQFRIQNSEFKISIEDLPKGIYFIKVSSNKETITKRFIKL